MHKNIIERNALPVCGQIQATEALATSARAEVCAITKMLKAESRTHRVVGYKNSVSRFHKRKMSKCNELCNDLLNETYRPSYGDKYEVYSPKHRTVTSSLYRDRIPQASFVVNYFYPNVVPHLIPNNCACIKGRGTDYAREIFKKMLEEADISDYCLKTDWQNYFASIIHQKLYEELGEYITDAWAMHFFQLTVENTGSPVGLDLGSEVYQLSATAFPNKLDHLLCDGKYIRYQDDIAYIGSKDECRKALEVVKNETNRLGLALSDKKTFIQPISRPIKFLGFSFLKHADGHVTMKRLGCKQREERRKLRRMKRKGVPIERIIVHKDCVRAYMKKGSRADLKRFDDYFNDLFKEELHDYKERQSCERKEREVDRFQIKFSTRAERRRSQYRGAYPREVFHVTGACASS